MAIEWKLSNKNKNINIWSRMNNQQIGGQLLPSWPLITYINHSDRPVLGFNASEAHPVNPDNANAIRWVWPIAK